MSKHIAECLKKQVEEVRKRLDTIEALIEANVHEALDEAYWRFHAETHRLYILIKQLVEVG